MVSVKSVEKQLKSIKFNLHSWGKSEIRELPHILMSDEVIYECVNGMYEGGFALLVATDSRVLLVDKKPLNYLTVEDMRFEMINELDYSHRLIGAQINISAGAKNLKFKSYNQQRLRKLITHVQHEMAESKKQESAGQKDQKQHLEQINQQLQAYLIAQHQQQQSLRDQLQAAQTSSGSGGSENKGDSANSTPSPLPELPKPSPELADFLFAQSLLKQYREQEAEQPKVIEATNVSTTPHEMPLLPATDAPILAADTNTYTPQNSAASPQLADLYAEGMKEIFGRRPEQAAATKPAEPSVASTAATNHNPLEINPLSIAYSKLPMALRNRKFGRPSFHAHSQSASTPTPTQPLPAN